MRPLPESPQTERPPSRPPGRRRLAPGLLRFLLLLVVASAGVFAARWAVGSGYLSLEAIRALLERLGGPWWSPLVLIALYGALCPIGMPVTPLLVAGALVFGAWLGGLYSLVGSLLAAVLSYLLARWLGREFIAQLLGEERVLMIDRTLDRHGFWPLVAIRYVPVPFIIINYAAALTGVPLARFTLASALGLTPAILLFSYFSDALFRVAAEGRSGVVRNLLIATVTLLAINLIPIFIRRLRARGER